MMARIRRVFLAVLWMVGLCPWQSLHAADTGTFLFLNAAPSPVVAGETVRFQIVAVNQGTDIWLAPKTYLQAEIYDKNKKYKGKTERFRPPADTTPGRNLTADLEFRLPATYSGEYFFRVFLVHNDRRVIESDHRPFHVEGKPGAPRGPLPVTLGGSVTAGYKNDNGPSEYTGDTSVNLSGKAWDRAFDFSANAFHERHDAIDVQSVLLNYYGTRADVGLGDVSPSFSPLSVAGSGMRGGLVKSKELKLGAVGWEIGAVGARTAEAQEGSATADGVFRRMLYGTQSSFLFPGQVTVRGNYAQVEDVQDSVDVAGPTLSPVENRAFGGGAAWEGLGGLKVEADYQYSSFKANEKSTAPAATDGAWRTTVGYNRSQWSATTYVERTGTNFTSLAAPGVTGDRFTYDVNLSLNPLSWLSLTNSYNQFRDDLNDDPSKVATTQRATNNGATFTLPTQTSLNTGISVNTSVGSPQTTQDNRTVTLTFGVSQGWKGQSLSVNAQTSKFKDNTNASNDLRTDTYSNSLSLTMGERVSSSLGATFTRTDDLKDASVQESRSLSASVNLELMKEKLFAQVFGSRTNSEDNDSAGASKRWDTSLNLELTWKATSSLSATLGCFENAATDKVNPSSDSTLDGLNVKLAYSF